MANVPVSGDQRREVWWDGAVTAGAEAEFLGRRLVVKSVSHEEVIAKSKEGLRAVIVPLDAEGPLRARLADAFLPVLDSGAALLVALPEAAHELEDQALANRVISTLKRGEPEPTVRTVEAWEPAAMAQFCLEHNPGLAEAPALVVEHVGDLSASDRVLLRRAFSDFARIVLVALPGGHSGARVWRVDTFDTHGRTTEPFVVKSHRRAKITSEINRVKDFVMHRVPFPHYPPLAFDRCVEGATERLVVSMLVDRAIRMDEYLVHGSPRIIITALFDGPLRTWRANRLPANLQLAEEFRRLKVLPTAERLLPAHEIARATRAAARPPEVLLGALMALPRGQVQLMLAHGDLTIRNIYVRRDSTDVVLIDFAMAGEESPVSRDPATLDVSLGFDAIEEFPPLGVPILQMLYTRPILAVPIDPPADSRVSAIRQLRREVSGDGVSEREYEVAIACHLLRIATFADHGERRGIAYDLADLLV